MSTKNSISRRNFLATSGAALAGSAIISPLSEAHAAVAPALSSSKKEKLVTVGTGSRGCGMWGRTLLERYPDKVEFVGLHDNNPGRVETGKKLIGATCKTWSDFKNPMAEFDKMMKETKPDTVLVMSTDSTHDEYIVRGMELGANIITEKPMTTDEKKIQRIIDAEKKTGKKVRVTFNYRYSPHRAKMYELIRAGEIGELTSVDFNWYLDTRHGADYFRRWHRLMDKGGSLWVHKASHHFDLLNWWIDSDPEVVFGAGSLDHYGKNGKFRAENCRKCPHTKECIFYWDIGAARMTDFQAEASGASAPSENRNQQLYVNNEHHDGYLRDGCVFKNDIDTFDKHAATIKYMNGVQATYSLTAYSPYEGYRIAFNGTKGRIDAWIEESNPIIDKGYDEIILFKNFSGNQRNARRRYIQVPRGGGGHGGGDNLLLDQTFIPGTPDPLKQFAGVRDGSLSCLVGIAARHSIVSGEPVKIASLTTIKPQAQKIHEKLI